MRIDLHVHSKHSERPSEWILKKINCPESFAEPLQIYNIAKSRGMTHVTITDHNSIAGALEIAHLPDSSSAKRSPAISRRMGASFTYSPWI